VAKRGTLEHPKTKRLARAIGAPPWAALGLLEAFWHWVGRYRPQGFLTAEDFLDCMDTIRYDGDLSAVLTAAGFLEEAPGGWYVHDWHDHADDTVKKTLQKRGEAFASGRPPRKEHSETAPESVANDSVEPETAPSEPCANDSRTIREQIASDARAIRDMPEPEPKPVITPPNGGDGGPSPPPEMPPSAFGEVREVLERVAGELDWPPPSEADCRRHLKPTSPLRQLVSEFGIPEAAALFVFAAGTWRGGVTWPSVFDQRHALRAEMAGKGPPGRRPPDEIEFRKEPKAGLDFEIRMVIDPDTGEPVGRRFLPGTDRPFDEAAWREARRSPAA
jgi:hypothetical protein